MCRRSLIVTGADSEKTPCWITPLEMPLEPSVSDHFAEFTMRGAD
jgi:hypothetical protein